MNRPDNWTQRWRRTAWSWGILALLALAGGQASANGGAREALLRCVPGQPLADCQAALVSAGIEHKATPTQAPHHLWVPLTGSYLAVEIDAAESAGASAKIALVDFQSELAVGAARRQLVSWLRLHLPGAREIAAVGNRGCGASGGGPAWLGESKPSPSPSEPAVQLAIDRFASLRAGAGRPLDRVFIETRAKPLHLCFLAASPVAAGVMAEFVRSPLLDKALPEKAAKPH